MQVGDVDVVEALAGGQAHRRVLERVAAQHRQPPRARSLPRSAVGPAISRSRSTGSATPTGSGTIICPSTFPCWRSSLRCGSAIGTIARRTRPSTRSPRPRSRSCRPPATAVSSTSFTVASWRWAASLTRSRSLRTTESRRSEPIIRFRLLRGARSEVTPARTADPAARARAGETSGVRRRGRHTVQRCPASPHVVREQITIRRPGSRSPGLRGTGFPSGVDVEEGRQQRHRGRAVGDGVMHAQVQADPARRSVLAVARSPRAGPTGSADVAAAPPRW